MEKGQYSFFRRRHISFSMEIRQNHKLQYVMKTSLQSHPQEDEAPKTQKKTKPEDSRKCNIS